MKTQWLTKENKLDEALERGKAAVAADTQSAAAYFALSHRPRPAAVKSPMR